MGAKLIYIVAAGHSGSTLLDMLIGSIPGVFSTGELNHLPWQLSRTPGVYTRGGPCIGEHNDYVYGELLGMSKADIAAYTTQGILE